MIRPSVERVKSFILILNVASVGIRKAAQYPAPVGAGVGAGGGEGVGVSGGASVGVGASAVATVFTCLQ